MFRLRIGLKWFLLGTVAIPMLIGFGYNRWRQSRWLAAPVVAGKQQEFDEWQYRRWLDKQKSIRAAISAAGAGVYRSHDYLVCVEVLPTTDRRCLPALAEATELEVFGARAPLRDTDLLWLEHHPKLKRLGTISGPEVTNHSLQLIGTCKKLEYLWIGSSSITDEGLIHLRGLDRLEHLGLSSNRVTGHGLAPLAQLPRLSMLCLADSTVNDKGLAAIGKLRQLQCLDLTGTKVDGSGLPQLAPLTNLRTLRLSGCAFADGAAFGELDGITTLDLICARLRPGTLQSVAQMESLQELNLPASDVTDDRLAELSGARQLRELRLAETRISDDGLVHLQSLNGLRLLILQQTDVSEAGARRLAESLPDTRISYSGGSIGPTK